MCSPGSTADARKSDPIDAAAVADQEYALRRHQPGVRPLPDDDRPHERVARQQRVREARHVEQDGAPRE